MVYIDVTEIMHIMIDPMGYLSLSFLSVCYCIIIYWRILSAIITMSSPFV